MYILRSTEYGLLVGIAASLLGNSSAVAGLRRGTFPP